MQPAQDEARGTPARAASGVASGAALALGLGTFVLCVVALLAWARLGKSGWPARESLAATAAGGLTLVTTLVALLARSARRPLAAVGLVVAAFGLFLLWGTAGAIVARRPPPRAPVTEAEAAAFGALIAQRVMAGDAAFFDGRLDVDAMIARVGLTKAADVRGARVGWQKSQSGGQSLGSELVKAAAGGSYTFVRVREREGQWTAVLRLVLPTGGLNVHELFVTRGPDGQPGFDDAHMYMGDLRLSAMMVRMTDDPALAKQVTHLAELLRAGKNDELLAAYAALPREQQRRRDVRVLRLFSAARLGGHDDPRYMDAIRDLEEVVPTGDAAVALTLFDLHFQAKAFDRCAADLEAVAAVVGADAYVDALRCQIDLARGRPQDALRLARGATTQEPGLRLAHAGLLECGLALGDHAVTLEALQELEGQFQEDWGGVPEDVRFQAFVESPEFVVWQAGHAPPR